MLNEKLITWRCGVNSNLNLHKKAQLLTADDDRCVAPSHRGFARRLWWT